VVTAQTFVGLLPEIVAFLFSITVLMVGVFVPRATGLTSGLAAFGALATFVVTVVLLAARFEGSFYGGGYVVDDFALYFKLIVAVSAFFAVLAAARWSEETGDAPEYLNLILSVALAGCSLSLCGTSSASSSR
jgi:NADH-quinone oxidoreductase subunit N